MTALNELRETIAAHVEAAAGDRRATWKNALTYLDNFEATHPGLVDIAVCSERCPACVEFTTVFEMPKSLYAGCLVSQSESRSLNDRHRAPIGEPCPWYKL